MNSQPQDLDLSRVLKLLRRALPLTLLVALGLAAAAYLLSRLQAPRYAATATIAALPVGNNNSLLSTSLVTAPPVPPAVVDGALHSSEVARDALAQLSGTLPAAQLQALQRQLAAEAQAGRAQTVTLTSQVDQDQVGLYSLTAQAGSPAEAQAVANAFLRALLNWDRQRAVQSVQRAQLNLQAQRDSLSARLARASSDLERRSLLSARGDVLQALSQLAVLGETVTGTLSPLSEAVEPSAPISPKPLRDALLTFAFVLFVGLLLAGLLDTVQRRVRVPDDLAHLALPVIGTLPVIPRLGRDPAALRPRLRQGVFAEQMEFVRVALTYALGGQRHPVVLVVSSAHAGEGKSVVVAGLASSLAASGQRVLVYDADVFKPRQQQIWGGTSNPLATPKGLRRLSVDNIQGVAVAVPEHKHLDAEVERAQIVRLAQDYDYVLVDSPPLLHVAETVALAARSDGLLLVVGDTTPLASVERAVREAERLGSRIVGVVLNRVRERQIPQYDAYLASESSIS